MELHIGDKHPSRTCNPGAKKLKILAKKGSTSGLTKGGRERIAVREHQNFKAKMRKTLCNKNGVFKGVPHGET